MPVIARRVASALVLFLLHGGSAAADSLGDCPPQPSVQDGGFEFPAVKQSAHVATTGWKTNTLGHRINIWRSETDRLSAHSGQQFVELNGADNAGIYQDIATPPGLTIPWKFAHRGRFKDSNDTAVLYIGPPGDGKQQLVQEAIGNSEKWRTYRGTYTVPAGQNVTRLVFRPKQKPHESVNAGNYLDSVAFGGEACLELSQKVKPSTVEVGDTAEVTVTVINNGNKADDILLTLTVDDGLSIDVDSVHIKGALDPRKPRGNKERVEVPVDVMEGDPGKTLPVVVTYRVKGEKKGSHALLAMVAYADSLKDKQRFYGAIAPKVVVAVTESQTKRIKRTVTFIDNRTEPYNVASNATSQNDIQRASVVVGSPTKRLRVGDEPTTVWVPELAAKRIEEVRSQANGLGPLLSQATRDSPLSSFLTFGQRLFGLEALNRAVAQSSTDSVAIFSGPWCKACAVVESSLLRLAQRLARQYPLNVFRVEISEPEFAALPRAQQEEVRSPMLQFFRAGLL